MAAGVEVIDTSKYLVKLRASFHQDPNSHNYGNLSIQRVQQWLSSAYSNKL
jgi:hypothetical protein